MAKGQAVTTGELRRLGVAAFELVHHLAFGHSDVAQGNFKSQLFGYQAQFDRAKPNFAHKRVALGITALGGIGHGEQKAFVGAREVLQARTAVSGEAQRLAGQVKRLRVACGNRLVFHQTLVVEQVDHTRCGLSRRGFDRGRGRLGLGAGARRQKAEIQKALGVVVGGPQQLAARQVFEGGRYPPREHHAAGIDGLGVSQPGQGCAVGAQQENRLHQIARALLDGQCCKFGVVDRALGHDPVHR